MANYNRVLLMGNLTRDPEIRYTPSNTAVANIGIAVNRRWRNKQTNEMQEETTFVDCEAWSYTAEAMGKYLTKGRPIFIEGRLKLDQWQDQSGNNRSKLKVVIENFEFVDSRGDGGGGQGGGGGGNSARQTAPAPSGASRASGPRYDDEPPQPQDGDIPF